MYYLSGSRILAEKVSNGTTIEYVYDESGSPVSMYYNNVKYYFIKNLQGDVIQLRNAQNSVVANYSYDPWGRVLSVTSSDGMEITNTSHVAHMNPIRYRSYYYDVESGFYYLNSRYYDPVVARFINADEYVSTGQGLTGDNMYAYCGNNPVNCADSAGNYYTCLALSHMGLGLGGGTKAPQASGPSSPIMNAGKEAELESLGFPKYIYPGGEYDLVDRTLTRTDEVGYFTKELSAKEARDLQDSCNHFKYASNIIGEIITSIGLSHLKPIISLFGGEAFSISSGLTSTSAYIPEGTYDITVVRYTASNGSYVLVRVFSDTGSDLNGYYLQGDRGKELSYYAEFRAFVRK